MKYLLALFAMATLLMFTACSDDDDNGTTPVPTASIKLTTDAKITIPALDNAAKVAIPITIENTSQADIKIKPSIKMTSLFAGHEVMIAMGSNTQGKDYEKTDKDHVWGDKDNAIVLKAGEKSNVNSLALSLLSNAKVGTSTFTLILENYANAADKQEIEITVEITATPTPVLKLTDNLPSIMGSKGEDIKIPFHITNTGSADVKIQVSVEFIDITNGHMALMCFGGSCIPVSENATYPNNIVTLTPGKVSTDADFEFKMSAVGVVGKTKMKFIFVNVDNPSDTVEFISEVTAQ